MEHNVFGMIIIVNVIEKLVLILISKLEIVQLT